MASFNTMLFLTPLVAIAALMAAPSVVEAQLINTIINITGTITGNVPCTLNTTLFPNGTLTSNPFRNATVQLRCGTSNASVASTTANANGTFSIPIDPPGTLLNALVVYARTATNCSVFVITPLPTCNSTLPTNGTLSSRLVLGPIRLVGLTRTLFLLANRFVNRPV